MSLPDFVTVRNESVGTFGSFAAASMASLIIASTGGGAISPVASGLGSHGSSLPTQSAYLRASRKNQTLDSAREIQFVFQTYADEEGARPRTTLGKRLLELRAKAISKGMPLLSQDAIEVEIANIRGESDLG